MLKNGLLVLHDGEVFSGQLYGYIPDDKLCITGEVVFNTSMYGYQEILTDPSYAGQIVCFTNPHVGNVGCNSIDVESERIQARAVITRELPTKPSNYRARIGFEEWLKNSKITGIAIRETRRLVTHLRDKGAKRGAIGLARAFSPAYLKEQAYNDDYEEENFVRLVSCKRPYAFYQGKWIKDIDEYDEVRDDLANDRLRVVVIDCGVKRNILRSLISVGFSVIVVPWNTEAEVIKSYAPDGVLISNGPGNPEQLDTVCSTVAILLGDLPMFGICLGHQILARTLGGVTHKLKFGHRAANHPVKAVDAVKTEITSQNHGYVVNEATIARMPKDCRVTMVNLNDKTVEGFESKELGIMAVQYHPEASPGPHDSEYLFERFYRVVKNWKESNAKAQGY